MTPAYDPPHRPCTPTSFDEPVGTPSAYPPVDPRGDLDRDGSPVRGS